MHIQAYLATILFVRSSPSVRPHPIYRSTKDRNALTVPLRSEKIELISRNHEMIVNDDPIDIESAAQKWHRVLEQNCYVKRDIIDVLW